MIYAVDAEAEGRQLQEIVDASGEVTLRGRVLTRLGSMTYFDVSPDGSRIVYSTCGRPTSGEADYKFYDDDSGWVLDDVRGRREIYIPYRRAEVSRHGYEIVVSNIDGTGAKWLTENETFDNFPVWSPDGSRIAFVSGGRGLYTMSPDGSDVRLVSGSASRYPPSWSPDGRRLAFVAASSAYTVGADGLGQVRISKTISSPSWSPDGRRVALVVPEGGGAALYTFAPDGSDPVRVAGIADDVPVMIEEDHYLPWEFWVGSVSWSSDGSEILVGPVIVRLDDSEPPRPLRLVSPGLTVSEALHHLRTSWSPDGSKIAVQSDQAESGWEDGSPVLYTVDRDGENPNVLVVSATSSYPGRQLIVQDIVWPPADVGACSRGEIVPDPEGNPGLVEDCRVMLGMRDTLSGSGVLLDWSSDTPIAEWLGVYVYREPLRVREISLSYSELYGQIPPEMGSLTELRTLSLEANRLNGPIPPELGNLVHLEVLNLSRNEFTGSIPPELGDLEKLWVLDLSRNQLTGGIPLELGGMVSMQRLSLENNRLSGSIPPELDDLGKLRVLDLLGNPLEGCIPSALQYIEEFRSSPLLYCEREDRPADVEACSDGGVVPDPEGNPGLVEDCRVLLGIRDTLSGPATLGPAVLDWSSDTPIATWTGVDVEGEPLRVRGVNLVPSVLGPRFGNDVLYGQIPPELGGLTELKRLVIGGTQVNGPIPPELGNLTNLEHLALVQNRLTGSIPPELGSLARLRRLELWSNQLSGSIPPELGNLEDLEVLDLSGNQIEGCIPSALRYLGNSLSPGVFPLPYCE